MSEPIRRKRKSSEDKEDIDIIVSDKMKPLHCLDAGRPAAAGFSDLSHEMLTSVLEHLGYAHQQRLVRVCKLWMTVMTKELAQIYLDAESFYISHRTTSGLLQLDPRCQLREPLQSITPAIENTSDVSAVALWKHNRQTVRQLTFDGQYTAEYWIVNVDVLKLVEMCFPRANQATFLQVIMTLGSCCCQDCSEENAERTQAFLAAHFARLPLALVLKGCVVEAFPAFSHTERSNWHEAERLLGRHQNSHVPVADTVWRSVDEVSQYYAYAVSSQVAWAYPEEQLAWLARWTPCLNGHVELLAVLNNWRLFSAHHDVTCKEHSHFCRHLDLIFYRNMTGQMRNLLAAYLLQLSPPDLSSPPVPFRFAKLHLRPGMSVQFGPVT